MQNVLRPPRLVHNRGQVYVVITHVDHPEGPELAKDTFNVTDDFHAAADQLAQQEPSEAATPDGFEDPRSP